MPTVSARPALIDDLPAIVGLLADDVLIDQLVYEKGAYCSRSRSQAKDARQRGRGGSVFKKYRHAFHCQFVAKGKVFRCLKAIYLCRSILDQLWLKVSLE